MTITKYHYSLYYQRSIVICAALASTDVPAWQLVIVVVSVRFRCLLRRLFPLACTTADPREPRRELEDLDLEFTTAAQTMATWAQTLKLPVSALVVAGR